MTQKDLAARVGFDHTQLSRLENGDNIEVQFYERAARGLHFRHALDLFVSAGDPHARQLLAYFRALPTEQARTDVLQQVKAMRDGYEAPSPTSSGGTAAARKRTAR